MEHCSNLSHFGSKYCQRWSLYPSRVGQQGSRMASEGRSLSRANRGTSSGRSGGPRWPSGTRRSWSCRGRWASCGGRSSGRRRVSGWCSASSHESASPGLWNRSDRTGQRLSAAVQNHDIISQECLGTWHRVLASSQVTLPDWGKYRRSAVPHINIRAEDAQTHRLRPISYSFNTQPKLKPQQPRSNKHTKNSVSSRRGRAGHVFCSDTLSWMWTTQEIKSILF